LKTLLTLTLGTALAGFSSAATITQSVSYGFVPTGTVPLTFTKFDTTLGTLTGVTVSVDMTKQRGQLEVDNDSATFGGITMTHQVIGALSSTVSLVKTGGASSVGQSGSVTAINSQSATVGVSSGDLTTTFDATLLSDYAVFTPGTSTVNDSGNIDAAFINQYAFAGFQNFVITMGATQAVSATGLSALQQAFTNSDIDGKVTVVYEYNAVPEPASALLGGFGVLALLRRRRH
jgi:hypothetical protein